MLRKPSEANIRLGWRGWATRYLIRALDFFIWIPRTLSASPTTLQPSSMPEPTASDLIFSEQANHNFSRTLGELKRSTLSIGNRLQSIQQDAAFAKKVAGAYRRPLIANERCGSWYIDPGHKTGSAYFKSTDGHTSAWKFSTRRLNLHLLEIIGKLDGCIIVDSTRRGKSEYSSQWQFYLY